MTPTPDALTELADRCEKAAEGDRELDIEILRAISGKNWLWCDGTKEVVTWHQYGVDALGNPVCSLEEYTESIDAAMTLVPAGISVLDLTLSWDTLPDNGHPACTVRWYPPATTDTKSWHACICSGRNAALAICNAALTLRARAALQPSGDVK